MALLINERCAACRGRALSRPARPHCRSAPQPERWNAPAGRKRGRTTVRCSAFAFPWRGTARREGEGQPSSAPSRGDLLSGLPRFPLAATGADWDTW